MPKLTNQISNASGNGARQAQKHAALFHAHTPFRSMVLTRFAMGRQKSSPLAMHSVKQSTRGMRFFMSFTTTRAPRRRSILACSVFLACVVASPRERGFGVAGSKQHAKAVS